MTAEQTAGGVDGAVVEGRRGWLDLYGALTPRQRLMEEHDLDEAELRDDRGDR